MLTRNKNFTLIGIYISGMLLLPMLILSLIVFIRGEAEYVGESISMDVLSLTNFIVYSLLCIVLLLLTYKIFKQDFLKIDSWPHLFKQVGLGVLCTFAAALIGNSIVMLLGTTDIAANQELVASALSAMPFLMMITIVFLGPIVEEIIFRLVLMNLFSWNPIFSLIVSSLLFGFIHVLVGGLIHIIPYFLMGLVFGYFYLKHNNIWHVTILHILHNGLTVVLMFWAQRMMALYNG